MSSHPRLLTFAEAIATIAEAAGQPINYIQVTPEQYAEGLTHADLPDGMADLVIFLLTTVMGGRNASLGDGAQQALKKAPRDLVNYARDTACTGIWSAQPCH